MKHGINILITPQGSSHIDLQVVHMQSDMAPSNLRMRLKIRKLLDAHNTRCMSERNGKGTILLLDGWCISHILARVLDRCFNKSKLIGKLHAVAFACNNVHFLLRLLRTINAMVEVELDYVKVSEIPDDDNATHRSRLLDLTLRRSLRTRAREETFATNWQEIEKMSDLIQEMLNADWRLPRLRHLCRLNPVTGRRCCANRADAVAKVCHALYNAIFANLGGCLPASNKWRNDNDK